MEQSQDPMTLLRCEMQVGFSGIRSEMDERFAQVDERFAQMDERFAQVDERFAQMDERFAQMDKRLTGLDERCDGLERLIVESKKETMRHFDVVSEQIQSMIQLLVEEIRGYRSQDLARRVDRLEKQALTTDKRLTRLEIG